MALTAFASRLGTSQGRIQTLEASTGEYAFVLGDAEAGRFFELAPGDRVEVTQAVDVTGMDFVRASLRLRVPASTPSGLGWNASLTVDGMRVAGMSAKRGRERLATDLVANVSKLAGVHSVGVRLELVSA